MKLSPADQESLVILLSRIYGDIVALEQEFQLLIGDHDFRPRIDYFHDAVRAFTSGKETEFGRNRLSVELLAYDLRALRYIQSMPLSSFTPHGSVLSPHTQLVPTRTEGITLRKGRPDRSVREQISELYQQYSVLFAALLKPRADRDYHERTDNLNQDVRDLHDLINKFASLEKGQGSIEHITASIHHLEEEGLRHALVQFMHDKKFNKKENLQKLAAFIKSHSAKKDKEIKAIDSAHMDYALAQLAIFEDSKDMIKKMAASGMNIVGKFVEASIAEARRQMGR